MGSGLRSWLFRARLRWIGIGLAAVVILSIGVGLTSGSRNGVAPAKAMQGPAAAAVRTTPEWVEIKRPFQMFDLAGGGEFARLPFRFTARRDIAGTGREQTLTYGSAKPGDRFFRITLRRRGNESVAPTSLFIDIARSAAESGLSVLSSGLPSALPTRFGPVEVASMTLLGSGGRATCLGFRRLDSEPTEPLAFSGLMCLSPGGTADQGVLACTIDKLDLISAGDDEALQQVFAAAERARQPDCSPERAARFATERATPLFAAATLKHSLDAGEN